MSIYVGNFPNEQITDNRLNFNSYINSNVMFLNTNFDSHPNAMINFKNDYYFGLSNSSININKNLTNLFNINATRTILNTDINIKTLFNTLNVTTTINSNFIINLSNTSNSFIVNNNRNFNLLNINSNSIQLNINNSNKITVTNSNIRFNENLIFNSNNSISVNFIRSTANDLPVIIDNVRYNTLDILDNVAKSSFTINNDIVYNKPSLLINRLFVNSNIVEIYNSNLLSSNKTKVFSINSNGFINIGSSNINNPIDIQFSNTSNIPIIFNYLSSNDNFTINNRGYIGIGTINPNNFIDLVIKDDTRNVINPPILNFKFNYNSNLNYRTNNLITLQYIATSNLLPIYNDIDAIIDYVPNIKNNFFLNFTSQINITPSSINPPLPEIRRISVVNTLNNDYIINYGISNIVSYASSKYNDFEDLRINNVLYRIEFFLRYPRFLTVDLNEIGNSANRINPIASFINANTYQIEFTNYVKKPFTFSPYNLDNFLLKEEIITIYNGSLYNDQISIRLKERLYIEKGIYELNNFVDSITYVYQPPSDIIYVSSNQNFTASLSSDGCLNLGDLAPSKEYQLYVNKKSRINNLECLNISSIPERKNINFSYCNISNINKSFANSNIINHLNAQNAFINNLNISNLTIPFVNIPTINTSNISFNFLTTSNLLITSNIFNSRLRMIIGSGDYNSNITSNYILNINQNSNNNSGLGILSFHSNTNPSINIIGYSNNNFPFINLANLNALYSINMNNNNLNFTNNNNNFIYKHNNINNLLIFGNSNNVIFDLKPVSLPTNSTNKISFGYPYRFLTQNSIYNINNWDNIFNDNSLNSRAMFNVYGNVNLSSINNTPFISCIANDQPSPNEVINVCIGSNNTRTGYLLNVEGNAYFSSNIFVQSNVFAFGTIGNVSDIRIKDNLNIIENPIHKINRINGYTYTRKDTGKIESGLVAQEVLKVMPEVVNLNNDYYNISYGNLSGLLVEGIKELNMRLKNIEDLLKYSNFSNNP